MEKSKAQTHQTNKWKLSLSDLEQAFSYVKNGGLNLVLKLAKPPNCITVAPNSIILTTICKQNKQA